MNARFSYREMARFAREVKAPAAVEEFYARFLRKLEGEFLVGYNVAALGEDGDCDLSRRAKTGRNRTVLGGQGAKGAMIKLRGRRAKNGRG